MCVPFRGWMGNTKDLSAFERDMVVGARYTGLCVKNCIKNGPPTKGHPANLTQLWEMKPAWVCIPVERFWHLVECMPQLLEAVLKVCLMFCALDVYPDSRTSPSPEGGISWFLTVTSGGVSPRGLIVPGQSCKGAYSWSRGFTSDPSVM